MCDKAFTWQGHEQDNASHSMLHNFIVKGIQSSPMLAEHLRLAIQEFIIGMQKELDGCCNGYEFQCLPEGFRIDHPQSEGKTETTIVDYSMVVQALLEWTDHCQGGSSTSLPPK